MTDSRRLLCGYEAASGRCNGVALDARRRAVSIRMCGIVSGAAQAI
ncbi:MULTISPECIES: hypothetical protein [unclassified Tardiphaga]|nr:MULTISPECIES: hypothetical protein [unclassified Tardiphaga]